MIRINKKLELKYKLSASVYETMNQVAYATQSRSLGTNIKQVNTILSHPTFCDIVLPVIIGNNKQNSDWEREKHDYITSVQIAVPSSGYPLDLNSTFDRENVILKKYIDEYISENESELYNVDKDTKTLKSDKDIAQHIISKCPIIDYHKYFKFDNAKDYLYWIMANLSSQVANNPEDANKSTNIRFFIYDDKVVRKSNLEKIESKEKSASEAMKLKAKPEYLRSIALAKNILTFDELEELTDGEVYIEVFNYAGNNPEEFLSVIADKSIETKATIKKYIEVGILKTNEDNEIVDSKTGSIKLGDSIEAAVKYINNPVNSADVNKMANEYKSLTKK